MSHALTDELQQLLNDFFFSPVHILQIYWLEQYVRIILQEEMNHQKLSAVLDLSCMGHITCLYPVFVQIRSSISVAQH